MDLGGLALWDEELSCIGRLGSLPSLRTLHLGIRGSTVRAAAVESLQWLRLSRVECLLLDLRSCGIRGEEVDALCKLCVFLSLRLRLEDNQQTLGGADIVRLTGMLCRSDSRLQELHLCLTGEMPRGFWILANTEPRLFVHCVSSSSDIP